MSHVLCAVSGGADSMTLLHVLFENKSIFGIDTVSAFHLNHNIRGEEADSDEHFVQEFCTRLSIPYYSQKLTEIESSEASEDSLRKLRYRYLEECRNRIGADCIVTGHTISDQAETVLLNLGRGSGLKGLSGIPYRRDNIVRPLLCLSRKETEQYCIDNTIEYRTDSTNEIDIYKRNKVRHNLLPEMEEYFGNVEVKLSNTAVIAHEADEYLKKQADVVLRECRINLSSVNTLQLSRYDSVLIKYAIKQLFLDNQIPFDYFDINQVYSLINSTGRLQLKNGFFAQNYNNNLCLYKFDNDERDKCEEGLVIGINKFSKNKSVNVCLKDLQDIHNINEDYSEIDLIDYDKVVGELVLRKWKEGDKFSSNKRKNTKSLKKLFNEKKLNPVQKRNQMIISDDSGIVWLEGEGVSSYKNITKLTQKVLVIKTILEE
jgi:tRNA(Ile)-lysidine synthase